MDTGKIRGQRGSNNKDTPGKILFSNNARFAEVFNHTLLRDCPITAEDLEERDTAEAAFVELSNGERIYLQLFRDASRYAKKMRRVLSIFSVENQDDIDYQMPLRIMEEDTVTYAKQARKIVQRNREQWTGMKKNRETQEAAKEEAALRDASSGIPPYTKAEFLSGFRREDRIIPNITLVIYFGEAPWDGPRCLRDMFVESPFQSIAPDYEIFVLDVRRLSEQEILSYSDDLRVLFLMLKYVRDRDKLSAFMSEDKAFRNVPDDILAALTPYIGKRAAKLLQPQFRSEEGGIDMDRGFEKLFEDVKQEGWNEGRIEGRAEGKAEGRAEGKAEGRAEGKAEYKNEMHLDNDAILSKIISKFQISRDYALSLL